MSSAPSALPRRGAVPWLLPWVTVAAVLVLRLAFSPLVGPTAPFMLFVLAVAICAWVGGLWPGVLATALAAAAGMAVVLPAAGAGPLNEPVQLLQLAFFLAAGLAISGLAEATLRAQAERERLLREVETERNRIAEVLRQAPSFMCTLRGPDHVYERENELHRQLVGHRDVIGKPVREALPEVAAQGILQMLDGVYRSGTPFVAHGAAVKLARRPGQPPEERLLDFVYQPLRDAGGAVTGILVQGVDQTDRVTAQLELGKAQALTQSIIDGSPALIFVKDVEGRYLLANRSWAQLAGVTLEQARGRTDEAFFGAEAAERMRAVDLQVLSGTPLVVEEHVVVDGARRTFLSHKFPLRDEQGRVYAVCGVAPEISTLKQTEAALRDAERRLRELNEALEHRVRDRTAELEAANKELEAFSYSVSHDLRAPLRGVDGFSKIVLDEYGDKLDDQGRRYLERVRAGAQRMGALIDDLLRLARVSRSELKKAPVDLGELAHEVAQELQRANPGRDVELVISRPLPAFGDAQLLRVVLENLLGNAFKFTGKTPRARIEVSETRRDGVRAFFVRDNGAGFDMEYSKKLFAAFQRLHSANEFEGTGIGLATVERIITRHGGRIWGEGAPNHGATFTFSLEQPPQP